MLAGSTDVSDVDFGGGLIGAFVGPVAVTLRGVWLAWEFVAARVPEIGAPPALRKPASTAKPDEGVKWEVLRYIADNHCPNGRPQRGSRPMPWPDVLRYHIAPHWDAACDALDITSSRRPTLPSPKTVSRVFQKRGARD
jgi:hypothetical protein